MLMNSVAVKECVCACMCVRESVHVCMYECAVPPLLTGVSPGGPILVRVEGMERILRLWLD